MICNGGIHEGIKDMGNVICPFCEKELQECKAIYELCCNNQDMINDNGTNVCQIVVKLIVIIQWMSILIFMKIIVK